MSSSDKEMVLPEKKLMEHQYAEPWDDSDAILVVEGEKFHVHSKTLGFASPVLKKMFLSDFKEGKEKMLNLPGKDKSIIKDMLDLIYPGYFVVTDFSTCEALLEIAREYDIRSITLYVDDFLSEKMECSFEILQLAEDFELTKTHAKLVAFYVETWNSVRMFDDSWSNISDDTKIKIIKYKTKELSKNPSQPLRSGFGFTTQPTNSVEGRIHILNKMIHAFYPNK